ncbi:hypothetical protein [Mesorhizobium silamurunense]|uniref:hypothetical protein n=1 Tax=Mesorhizobium silamurunense TaxID=499528 RepID=UPI00177FCFE5|nr:hypothetical protein [Mesorhizobium silamurunense]
MNDVVVKAVAVIAIFGIGVFVASSGGCAVDTNKATRALNAMGIHDVTFGGYAWMACDKNDTFASTFKGTGADGAPVSGAVCQGAFKNITVRFD